MGPAGVKEAALVAGKDQAGNRRQQDAEDGRTGKREGDRIAGRQSAGHQEHQKEKEEEFHQASPRRSTRFPTGLPSLEVRIFFARAPRRVLFIQQNAGVRQQRCHEFQEHGDSKDQQEAGQHVFDIEAEAALRDFEGQ